MGAYEGRPAMLWKLGDEFAITELRNMSAEATVYGEVVELEPDILIARVVRVPYGFGYRTFFDYASPVPIDVIMGEIGF